MIFERKSFWPPLVQIGGPAGGCECAELLLSADSWYELTGLLAFFYSKAVA